MHIECEEQSPKSKGDDHHSNELTQMHRRPRPVRRIDSKNGSVVIRVCTFYMKESGNGSNDNAGQKQDGGQPH
jgi:hypothetical protein